MRLHWFGRLAIAGAVGATGCSLLVDSSSSSPDGSCLEHGECETGVCERGRESCLSEDEIIYLDGSGVDAAGCGSRAQPCRQPTAALERVTDSRRTLLLRNGEFEPFVVDGDQVERARILVVGSSDARLVGGAISAEVRGLGSLALEDLIVTGATAENYSAIECSGKSVLRMRHVEVHDNTGRALAAYGCLQLSIESSTFRDNRQGIFISVTPFEIVNNFIVRNGDSGGVFAAVHIYNESVDEDISPGRFEFNTVAQNQSAYTWGVHCEALEQTMSNNIVVSTLDDTDVVSGDCTWAYSNIQHDMGAVQDGVGNMNDPASFVDPDEDFHLRSGSPCIDKADPAAALEDPVVVDFDGDPRPAGDAPDIGADELN